MELEFDLINLLRIPENTALPPVVLESTVKGLKFSIKEGSTVLLLINAPAIGILISITGVINASN